MSLIRDVTIRSNAFTKTCTVTGDVVKFQNGILISLQNIDS